MKKITILRYLGALFFFCVVLSPAHAFASVSSVSWNTQTPPLTGTLSGDLWDGVTWAATAPNGLGGSGLFVAVASPSSANHVIMTSPDGLTWTVRSVPSNAHVNFYSIAWSPELSLFVAVGPGAVMTSPDGVTWTLGTPASSNVWTSVTWADTAPNGLGGSGLFVAVAQTGTGNRVMTSPDGFAWASRTSAANNRWVSVTWSPFLNLFVAVADSGSNNRVMTSANGTAWTIRTSPANINWFSVVWSPTLNIFVAVAGSGSGIKS